MKKTADSIVSLSKPKQVHMNSEESERAELLNQVLETTMLTEETVQIQKDRYMLEGK